MNDLPYLRLHPRDFFSDPNFIAMTNEQAGAYIRLFCMAWLSDPPGTLPNDDDRLAALCQANAMAWSGMRSAVLAPFVLRDGRWHHPLQTREYAETMAYRTRQSDNATKGWQRRGKATAMPPHPSGIATAMPPSPSPSPEKDSARARSSPMAGKTDAEIIAADPAMRMAYENIAATKRRNAEALARQNGVRP